jgi:hypothetical protein
MVMCINVAKTKSMSVGRGALELPIDTRIHSGFV